MFGAALGLVGDVVSGLFVGAVGDAVIARATAADVRRLQRQGVLSCALRAVDGGLGRFGTMWLSSEWHVSPGRVHVGSTTVIVDAVDADTRPATVHEFSAAGLDSVVLTLRGPGPTVEIAMLALSEEWFREAVAPRSV